MAKPSKRVIDVNMEGVETGGTLVPEGSYTVTVDEVTQEISGNQKPYLKWILKVSVGPRKGATLYHQTSLQPQALFNLKNTLIALGVPVPNSLMKLNLDDLEGKSMGVEVEHEKYEGKTKSRVVDVFPTDGADTGSEEEVDLDEMDLDELLEYAEENEIDLSDLSKKDKKNADKVREAIEAALEEGGDDTEDDSDGDGEGDGDEAPDLEEMDLDELLAYAKENDIDLSGLDKKDKKKAGKVRKAIQDAMEDL